MKQNLTAYARATRDKMELTTLLKAGLGNNNLKKLTDKDLNSLLAHLRETINKVETLESEEKGKGGTYLLSLYICSIAGGFLFKRGLLE